VAALVAVIAGSAGVAWIVRAPNLALGRPATSSSAGGWGTTPAGAVDGVHYGWLGFHSSGAGKEWWSVDLGGPVALNRVVAFGRACCFDQSIPLAFEVSLDGKNYREAARRDEPFSQFDPWEVTLDNERARFVRFRTLRDTYLVLGEVEVYGRPPDRP
jgi:hypothetical protein